jgi:Ca2+-binding RTX toxin-like protein
MRLRARFVCILAVTVACGCVIPSVANAFEPCRDRPTIVGTPGDDVLYGTPGDDVIVGNGGNDKVYAGDGNDIVCMSGTGRDYVRGGNGSDLIYGSYDHGVPNYYRNPVPDTYLTGNAGNDRIEGAGTLAGAEGDDTLYVGSYDTSSQLYGGPGNDRLVAPFGAGTRNVLEGGTGDDSISGGRGRDTIHGGEGNDGLEGRSGDDSLYGESGNDHMYGNAGQDVLFGGAGNDNLYGNENEDFLDGESGNDRLLGGRARDFILGGLGKDYIDGGPSYDRGRTGGQYGDKVIVPIDGITFS